MRTFFLLILFLAVMVPQASSNDCATKLDPLLRTLEDVRSDWLTPEDKASINAVYTDSTLAPREKAEISFDIYLEARLRNLPKEDQREIRNVLAKIKVVPSRRTLAGSYRWLLKSIKVQLPKPFIATEVEKAILVHEIEHAIQHLATAEQGSRSLLMRFILRGVETVFLLEDGAMVSELKYIKSIPVEDRVRLLTELESLPASAIDKESHEFIKRLLENADQDIETYLNIQRKSGRYSQSSIIKNKYLPLVPVTALAGGLLACGFVCNNMWKNGDFRKRTFFWVKICEGVVGFPSPGK